MMTLRSARGARRGEGSVVQASKGIGRSPPQGEGRGERREGSGLQLRVTVGKHAQGSGGKELLGSRQARWWPCDQRQLRPSDELGRLEQGRCPGCRVATSCLRLSRRCSSTRRSRSSTGRSSQSVRRLATSQPGRTGDSGSFDRPSSSCEYSSLPRAKPCQHSASRAAGAREGNQQGGQAQREHRLRRRHQ